ncbi:LysE family translocator, partial [Mesorhizobium sp. M4A.F.Ca.ET.022.05.2.1]|uniref:LysE family translocator n=1 Tax=Mesorhizobium sp. M4A.F.Ca.ET.022.05.2.1 TaxID=2496653 RepID=UPI000FD51A1B
MIDLATLATYVAVVLGFVFIPGPATLLTVARATSSGTKVGIATGAGIAAGDIFHTVMAMVGISAIIATSAMLFSIVKYIGAAYLVYLGIRAIIEKTSTDPAAGALAIRAGNRQAVLTEMLNPKTALFFLAFLPQFVRPENGSVMLQLAALGIIFVLLGLFSTVVFAVSAGGLGAFLRRNPAVLKWQGKVVGAIY